MPPKAKAKGMARGLGVLRRPAARGAGNGRRRGALRRPAAMEEEKGEDHADPVPLHTVPLEQFKPGSAWVIPEASYFGGQVKLAGVIQRVEVLRNASYLYMHLTGTDSEDILKIHTGQKDAVFKGHICEPGCGKIESDRSCFMQFKGARGGHTTKSLGYSRWRGPHLEGRTSWPP